MTMNASFTLLFYVLALAGASVLLVYIGATIYYKRKQAQFWNSVEKLDAEPQTEAERAAYEQYDAAEGFDVEFVEPEGDAAAESVSQEEVAKDVAEMAALFKQRERERLQQSLDYDAIKTDVPFTDLDGQKYKFVENPNYDPDAIYGTPMKARVKMKLTGAISNSNAIPFPDRAELSRIMKRQAVEDVENIDGNVLNMEGDSACEICGICTEHNHAGGEVRRFIFDRAETTFKKYVEDMDLTKLPAEDVQKLWARCKARIEQDASLSAMLNLDSLFVRAQKIAQEDAEDEAFFKQTCIDAEKGPVTKCDKPAPMGYANCTRGFGHGGPCALPKYVENCGNCEDLPEEYRAEENCGCSRETIPPTEQKPQAKDVQPIPMPKRFMEGITRQLSQENAYEGLKNFGEKLAENVEEEDRHKVFAGVGELMTKLSEVEEPLEQDARSASLLLESVNGLSISNLLLDKFTDGKSTQRAVIALAGDYAELSPHDLLAHSQAIWLASKVVESGKDEYKVSKADMKKIGLQVQEKDSDTRTAIVGQMKKNLAEYTGRKPEEFVDVPGEKLKFDIAKAIEELEYDRKFVEDAERPGNEFYPSKPKPKRKPKARTAELRKSDLKKKRPRKK
jgi:hypothetical protein